ncbi:hypothetical protein CLV51_103358 [Chitinophaga niastensis]|uniref:Uncharacterized protein n=1 Tax=Chitinophaga niastensis TaxID=536980 RepID=A0A2P8HJN0_CHINA|nr:hypothetical protein [Chitinophaga niastensis]PSL46380.1 hypothetical protein CLV51_103358 [Chitinophaga niastensis]
MCIFLTKGAVRWPIQAVRIKIVRAKDNDEVIKLNNSKDVIIKNALYYNDEWNKAPAILPPFKN